MRDLLSFRGELPRGPWFRQFLPNFLAASAFSAVVGDLRGDPSPAEAALLAAALLVGSAAAIACSLIMFASTAKRARYLGRSPWG